MSWNLFGVKDAGEGVGAALNGAGGFVESVRSALTGDLKSGDKASLLAKATDLESLIAAGAHENNKADSQHASLFVAGWRPAIGWTCAIAFALYLVAFPIYGWYLSLLGLDVAMPVLHMRELLSVMGGMLGFGVSRLVEKLRGVQGNH